MSEGNPESQYERVKRAVAWSKEHPVLWKGVPLALKIFPAVLERYRESHPEDPQPEKTVKELLRWLVNRETYLRNVAAGGVRYDLDGNVAGEVSDSHRAYAEKRLADVLQKNAEKGEEGKAQSEAG